MARFEFQRENKPTNECLGWIRCPNCQGPIRINSAQWLAREEFGCSCGMATIHNFQTEKAEQIAAQLQNQKFDL